MYPTLGQAIGIRYIQKTFWGTERDKIIYGGPHKTTWTGAVSPDEDGGTSEETVVTSNKAMEGIVPLMHHHLLATTTSTTGGLSNYTPSRTPGKRAMPIDKTTTNAQQLQLNNFTITRRWSSRTRQHVRIGATRR